MSDLFSKKIISEHLTAEGLQIHILENVPSTNAVLKTMAAENAPEGCVVIASQQTAGKGRMGREFFSPEGSGIYMSLLLRPKVDTVDALSITSMAAVAAAEAIEQVSGREARIKWVNDIYIAGKKSAGILAEGSLNSSGSFDYIVLGIGINCFAPSGGFPAELRDIATNVFEGQPDSGKAGVLAAEVLNRFMRMYKALPNTDFYSAYKARSLVPGRRIRLLSPGKEPVEVFAEDINHDFSLLVRYDDGTRKTISSGEVSLRFKQE